MTLDVNTKEFQQWLDRACELVLDYVESVDDKKVFMGHTPADVIDLFNEPLPEEPAGITEVLDKLENDVLNTVTNSAGPRYFGYITGGGNQAAVLAEMIKASLNQNNLKWHSSPISTEMERLVMRWVAEFMGYPSESAGVLLSGGSVANFNALAVARTIKAPVNIAQEGIYNCPPMTLYVSSEGHSSFDKAVDMLGIGKKHLRKIPVDDDLRINIDELEHAIETDRKKGFLPICVIGVAGTTNNGAVDDLAALAQICQRHNLWYHVDAAYGGPAAGVDSVSTLFKGMKEADSIVVNPHKWMYVPFEAGGLLIKNPEYLRQTFSTIPDYLKSDQSGDGRTDLMEYNLPLTKEFKSLKVWMTLKTYGAQKIREAIKSDIDKAEYLVNIVRQDQQLEMMAPAPLSIVCFRYNPGNLTPETINNLNDQMVDEIEKDGRIFLTGTKIKGHTALRVCLINHRTKKSDIDYLVRVVNEVGEQCYQNI